MRASTIIFVIAVLAVIYLIFIHTPKPAVNFHGPTGAPTIQGPQGPVPQK
jgi:hypothetical protein